MRTDYDALVIGGGPAGSTAAILLADAGWSVALVEKSVFPRRKVCGEVISGTNIALFEQLGVLERLRDESGPPLREVGLYRGVDRLHAQLPRVHGSGDGYGFTCAREQLDTVLRDRAASRGVSLWQPWRALTLTPVGGWYDCLIEADNQRRVLRAPVVIAAHGSWESGTLPTQAFDKAHRGSDLLAFKAHFYDADLRPGLLPVLAFPGGYGGIVRIAGGRTTVACCIRRDTVRQCRTHWPGLRAAEAVQVYATEQIAGLRAALREATADGAWLSVGPLRTGRRRPYVDGVFVIGNAYCETHPVIGEGITMALQSAWLLTRRLLQHAPAQYADPDAGLTVSRAFARDWQRAFAWRMYAAAVFAHAAMRASIAAGVLPVLRRFPQLLTLGARVSGKVSPIDLSPTSSL
jgi:flavin-dependent dehydrogenase